MDNIITRMDYQGRNKNRVSVFINEEFAFSVPLLRASGLHAGQHLSLSEIEELKAEYDAYSAYAIATRYLISAPRSRREIARYLQRKKIEQGMIEATLLKLEENALINDEAFARIFVENRERFGPRSKAALRYELKGKGIEAAVIEQVTEPANDLDLAMKAIGGRMRRFRELKEDEFREKGLSFLARRGFTYEVAAEAVEKIFHSLEEERQS